MTSAVLFLVFSRPDTTRRVFDAIREAKPPRLYVAADGPRSGCAGESERCEEVRRIATNVDWHCEVRTLFQRENLGCRHGPSAGISWFFDQETEGIVLEDDCLPSPGFFQYCDTLLERYRDDERIFLITGYNKRGTWKADRYDYFFSNYGGIWGWASWRRAWRHFDLEMKDLEACIEARLFEYQLGKRAGKARREALQRVKDTSLNTWDYQWGFARHKNNGLACVPSKSLIENIGFGQDATHTVVSSGARVTAHEMEGPLRPNTIFVPDRDYDEAFVEPASGLLERLRVVVGRALRYEKT